MFFNDDFCKIENALIDSRPHCHFRSVFNCLHLNVRRRKSDSSVAVNSILRMLGLCLRLEKSGELTEDIVFKSIRFRVSTLLH